MADPLMTIFGHYYFIYICVIYSSSTRVQLEFNSHLTSERRSTEITVDYSSSHNIINIQNLNRQALPLKNSKISAL